MWRNTASSWGNGSKLLHWISALAIIFSIAFGWWMTHLLQRSGRLPMYQLHGAIAYYIVLLIFLRLIWRALNPLPQIAPDARAWERTAALFGHWALYIVTLASAVSGWLLAGTFKQPLTAKLFGLVPVPMIVNRDRALHQLYESWHMVLSYLLLALIFLHVAAALRHHLLKKNDVLRGMWWRASVSR